MSAGRHSIQRFRLNPAAHTRLGHLASDGAHWEMTCRAPHRLHSALGRCGEPIEGLAGLTFDEVSALTREDLANGVERLCTRHQAEQAAARERSEQEREPEASVAVAGVEA